ncbi:envelope stress response membrane protein PspB [Qipengyuania sp. JC766]|uniref:envelope stress response membrane protein PspB n=1 Tax=Qipengyuania sp. JC766 TaxID=3232139 RepID=UPI00345A0800
MDWEAIIIVPIVVVGLPWLILHYVTKWKTAATITSDDEALLEDLYQLAKRLDERMDTVERLVAADHPEFERTRLLPNRETDNQPLHELDRLITQKKGTAQ